MSDPMADFYAIMFVSTFLVIFYGLLVYGALKLIVRIGKRLLK